MDDSQSLTERYATQLRELLQDSNHRITREFRALRDTWNNMFTYEQARWRWATEERHTVRDTSFAGSGPHAFPRPPEQARETAQAVQRAIQETATAREARAAWLLDPAGTTREQSIHQEAERLRAQGKGIARPVQEREQGYDR